MGRAPFPPGSEVLYVTYDGLLEPLGAAQVLPYVLGLARLGFRMRVMSYEKPRDLGDVRAVTSMSHRLAEAGVGWTRRRYHRWPSLVATGWDVAGGIAAAGATRGAAPALVHARSYVAGSIALAIAGRTSSRFLFDMRGFWVDERIEAGLWQDGSLTVRLMRSLERRLLAAADAVVTLTSSGEAALRAEYPLPRATPVRVIPTCVDLDRFAPAKDPVALRAELGLGRGPVVVYAGSLSTWYLAEMTIAIGLAFARRTGGHFLILSREEELARGMVARAGGGEAVTIRSVPHAELPRWLSACDAGLAPVMATPSKRASAPTKIGEYLACGLAVAATGGVGDLDAQLADTPAGFTFDPATDPDRVALGLIDFVEDSRRPEAARALAERHYALGAGVAAFADLYRELGVTDRAPDPDVRSGEAE